MELFTLLAIFGPALAQYALNPYGYVSSYNGYGTSATLPYYGSPYGASSAYGSPYSGAAAYGYGVYPSYGYTGTLLGSGYGYPAGYGTGYPYGTGTGTIGTGTGTGIVVGDGTGGGVGVITGTAPGTVLGTGTGTVIGTGTGEVITNPGVIGTGAGGIVGATGITSSTSSITGTVIPGTLTTGDTLIVTGVAPSCCPPGIGPNDSVWSVNLLSVAEAPYVSMAVKNGWTRFTINSAINGWTGGWYPVNPPIQVCPFHPNTPYTMQITNTATGLSILINNLPYNYPHVVGGGVNVYNSLGFVGYDKGTLCSVTLVRGGVSSVIAVGTGSALCGTIVG